MRMAYFGRKLDAPIYDGAPHISTPVGVHCIWCHQPFVMGDDGFMYVSGEYTHRACNLRAVLGPVADSILELENG